MKQVLQLSALTHLRIHEEHIGNAWRIRLPRLGWRYAGASEERQEIVARLTGTFPCRSLWLTDLATDGEPRWERLGPGDDLYSVGEIDHGGWALFYFPEGIPMPDRPLDGLALDAVAATSQMHQLCAHAAITSLVDDDEWILVVAGGAR